MRLQDKLSTTPSEQFRVELDNMLDRASVSISWWGERLVTVDGYEGSVTINELSRTFLRANPLRNESPSLKGRIDYYNLWTRMQGLYNQSDAKLKRMCAYKFLVPLSEFRPYCRACAGDPMARIGEWDDHGRDALFEFSPQEYKTMWPESQPNGKSWSSRGEFWYATKEMVETELQKQQRH